MSSVMQSLAKDTVRTKLLENNINKAFEGCKEMPFHTWAEWKECQDGGPNLKKDASNKSPFAAAFDCSWAQDEPDSEMVKYIEKGLHICDPFGGLQVMKQGSISAFDPSASVAELGSCGTGMSSTAPTDDELEETAKGLGPQLLVWANDQYSAAEMSERLLFNSTAESDDDLWPTDRRLNEDTDADIDEVEDDTEADTTVAFVPAT